jgi:transcriptional regulator with XRE-family HTH domain
MPVPPESQQRQSESIGRMLRSVRVREVGHNFPEYAKKLGMKPLQLSNWESGRNGLVDPDQIENWAKQGEWGNNQTMEFYFASGHKLPTERVEEHQREWDLAVYHSKFNGQTHPFVGAMNELLDHSAKQNTFLAKLQVIGAVARALLRR